MFRDLKPENVLVDVAGHIRLADFGLCIFTSDTDNGTDNEHPQLPEQTRKLARGSLEYIPPEVLTGEPYAKTSDIHGLGVFLYELLMGRTPYHSTDQEEMIR